LEHHTASAREWKWKVAPRNKTWSQKISLYPYFRSIL